MNFQKSWSGILGGVIGFATGVYHWLIGAAQIIDFATIFNTALNAAVGTAIAVVVARILKKKQSTDVIRIKDDEQNKDPQSDEEQKQ